MHARLKHLARTLAQLSLNEQGLVCAEHVDWVLDNLKNLKKPHKRHLLKYYKQSLERTISQQTAVLEYAGTLSKSSLSHIQSFLSTHYNRPITLQTTQNQRLIAGIRLRINDDVWEQSLSNTLQSLL